MSFSYLDVRVQRLNVSFRVQIWRNSNCRISDMFPSAQTLQRCNCHPVIKFVEGVRITRMNCVHDSSPSRVVMVKMFSCSHLLGI